MTKHGIIIKRKSNGEVVRFIEVEPSRALKVLNGVRQRIDTANFTAQEDEYEPSNSLILPKNCEVENGI